MEASFDLTQTLQQLGMIDAFSDRIADFTGIVSKQDDQNGLCISKVRDFQLRQDLFCKFKISGDT